MFVLLILLCSAGFPGAIGQVSTWGDNLSRVDSGSEANALREVRHFLEDGVGRYYGLGNVKYPGMYPDDGATEASLDKNYDAGPERDYIAEHAFSPEGVYTHYPPGPEYLIYASARLLGFEPVWRLRLVPIAVGWAATIFLGLSIRRRFGDGVACIVMGICAITPEVSDVFTGLHCQGYTFALLMCEMAVAIGSGVSLMPFALVGFLQGTLTFDYAFLVCLAPIAIEAMLPRIDPDYRSRWPLAWRRAVLAGAAFAFAHMLHFLQVWAYWGDFTVAVRDLGTAASHRSGAVTEGGIAGYFGAAWQLIYNYYFGDQPFSPHLFVLNDHLPTFRLLAFALGPWWILITALLGVTTPHGREPSVFVDWLWVGFAGFLVSSAWFLVMINHGTMHQFYLYRHLFFGFFMVILFGAARFARNKAVAPRLLPAE